MKTVDNYKIIPIFPNYSISSDGIIISNKTKKIIKTPSVNNCGYRLALLRKDNKRFARSIHRLIAITYLGLDESSKLTVDHIDRDKNNNKLNNLRILTHSDNMMNRNCHFSNDNLYIYPYYLNGNKTKQRGYVVDVKRNKKRLFYKRSDTLEQARLIRNQYIETISLI